MTTLTQRIAARNAAQISRQCPLCGAEYTDYAAHVREHSARAWPSRTTESPFVRRARAGELPPKVTR